MGKRRQDEEAEILARASTAAHGPRIIDEMWSELDRLTDVLMRDYPPEVGPKDEFGDITRCYEMRGQAQGVAWCIAVLTNPYEPNIDGVRDEAMERYEAAVEKRPAKKRVRNG